MLHPPTVWQSLMEVLLNLSALTNKAGTGSCYQMLILRMMGVKTQGPVAIARGTTFVGPQNLSLGRYVTIGANSRIVAWTSIKIGNDFMASDSLTLNSGGHHPVTLEPRLQPITIGSRVWCGANVTICAGVDVADDVVIGANSVVIRSLAAGMSRLAALRGRFAVCCDQPIADSGQCGRNDPASARQSAQDCGRPSSDCKRGFDAFLA